MSSPKIKQSSDIRSDFKSWLLVVVTVIVSAMIFSGVSGLAAYLYNVELERRSLTGADGGVFGDRFGLLTAMGSILSSLLFAFALIFQIREFRIMTKEYRESREEASRSADAQENLIAATREATEISAASAIAGSAATLREALRKSRDATAEARREAEVPASNPRLEEFLAIERAHNERFEEFADILGHAYAILRAEVKEFEVRRRDPGQVLLPSPVAQPPRTDASNSGSTRA